MVYTFTGGGHRAELMPGSNQMRLDGRFIELSEPLVLRSGLLLAPGDFAPIVSQRLRPPGPSGPTQAALPPDMSRIMIDPGHGGDDPGAVANGLREKDIVLDIARRAGKLLQERGWTVGYTRSGDTFIELDGRADRANRFQADVFVSIHANSAASGAADGFETFVVDNKYDNADRGREAAKEYDLRPASAGMRQKPSADLEGVLLTVLFEEYKHESREMAAAIQSSIGKVATTSNRGVKLGPWRVVRKANCTHCLIEVGFLSNRAEAADLGTAAYRRRLAAAIADGIDQLRTRFRQTRGFTQ